MKRLLAFALALALAACAHNPAFVDGRKQLEGGNVEQGLATIEQAMKADPDNAEIRNYYLRHKAVAVQRYLAAGDNARGGGGFEQAQAAYERALQLDPDNARARAGLDALKKDLATVLLVGEAQAALKAGNESLAHDKAKAVLAQNPGQRDARAIVRRIEEKKARAEAPEPQLAAALKKPISIEFRDAPLRQVFDLIAKRSGLNFVFDRDVPPDARATVHVKNSTIEEAIKFVLLTNQLERRVLNENTVLVYPTGKQREYKDLTVRTFYLANADARQTANLIRQVVKTRDVFVDEKLNLLVMRDTPEAVKIAEKLVMSQDLGEPEVMLEVEVLEVSHTHLQNLGIQWPGQAGVSVLGAAGVAGQLTLREARSLTQGMVRLNLPDPLVTFNFRAQDGRTNVLANPRIRVKNKEKAKIHIGDRVPVVTTTAGATGFVSESVNYLDVGLKLEVEPIVYLEDEVGIKVALEVSNIAREIRSSSGTVAYQVGTRNAATTLRLKDGETQVLAGLINDEDRRNATRVPGLSDMGALGRLFSNNDDTVNKTEIVLLITPRVVRNLDRPDVRLESFNAGTDAELGGRGGEGVPFAPAPAAPQPQAPAQPPVPSQPQPETPRPPAAGPAPRPQ